MARFLVGLALIGLVAINSVAATFGGLGYGGGLGFDGGELIGRKLIYEMCLE